MNRKWRKQITAGMLAAALVSGSVFTSFAADYTAAPDGKTDASEMASTMGISKAWNNWKSEWEEVKTDWTQISLTPGSDASQLNFAWYTKKAAEGKNKAPKLMIGEGKTMRKAKVYTAAQTEVEGETDSEGNTYYSNKVTVKGLKENKTYYYSYNNGNGYTKPEKYKTKSTDEFSFIYVGDPQIGSSNELKGEDSDEFYAAQSDSVRSDSFNWAATLNAAMKKSANKASFVVSAGDQIQTTKKKSPNKDASKSEIEYTGYLSPEILKSLPVATTVGNHDADNANYTYHFNTPNSSELGSNGIVGGDYYFTYGDVLFMMLNTQDTNVAEHKQFIEQAVEANKDCKWRIVTLHQDIYGSAEHSNEPEITNLRYELTPYFEENDVDAVLTGHDHAYSRSKMLLGGTQSELAAAYTDDEFDAQLDKDMDTKGDEETTLFTAPGNIKDDTTDPEEQKYLEYLNSIMDADAVEKISEENDTVFNPEGILYMTASSSSGSKYYDLVPRMQTYIAGRWQEDVPTYSVIDVDDDSLTINTYRTDNGEKIDKSFTIVKGTEYREQLQAAVNSAKKNEIKAKHTYTAASYKVFAKAYCQAVKVLRNKKATETELKNAYTALTEAKAGLVKKACFQKKQ
ncbi:MAG: metallophosphoesterase family protein [Lachnospiraceae bacterium]|nr:metallophosphoesterase family protein [Lachnospiraceae bacterium]